MLACSLVSPDPKRENPGSSPSDWKRMCLASRQFHLLGRASRHLRRSPTNHRRHNTDDSPVLSCTDCQVRSTDTEYVRHAVDTSAVLRMRCAAQCAFQLESRACAITRDTQRSPLATFGSLSAAHKSHTRRNPGHRTSTAYRLRATCAQCDRKFETMWEAITPAHWTALWWYKPAAQSCILPCRY